MRPNTKLKNKTKPGCIIYTIEHLFVNVFTAFKYHKFTITKIKLFGNVL